FDVQAAAVAMAQGDKIKDDSLTEPISSTPDYLFFIVAWQQAAALGHGQVKLAQSLTAQGAEGAQRFQNAELAADYLLSEAIGEWMLGMRPDVAAVNKKALATSSASGVTTLVALLEALSGNDKSALARMDELSRKRPQDKFLEYVNGPHVRATLELNH